jgi:hypothetical protein
MNRNTYILVGVLVVLVGVAFLVMQKPGERSSTGETGEFLASVDSLGVDKVEIKSPSSHIVLEKRGVEWFVQQPVSYRADQGNVASLIHEARVLEVKNIVSDKPEKHTVFQVDSTGTLVTFSEKGAEKASFILGKSGGSYSEVYARRSSTPEVLLVGGGSPYLFNRPVKEWRDRTVAATPRNAIKEIRFQYGDTTFVLAIKDSMWMVGKDSTQDWVVNNLISTLSNIQADDFVDTLITRPPKATAQISFAGTQITFFYVKQGDKYLVQSSSSPQWYEMQSWRANQILKRKKEITKSGK